MKYQLKINGKTRAVDAEPDTPLLWVVRDGLNLTGTKYGCGVAACGACTLHVNGEAVRSCQIPVQDAAGADIVTIEGLKGRVAAAVLEAWRERNVVQCGYCQSGQIMSAVGLLTQNPKPSETEIIDGLSGNLCRCATYHRVKDAVKLASAKLGG